MKKTILMLLLSLFVATQSKATITFTHITPSCDTTGVLALHFTGTGSLPYKIHWFVPGHYPMIDIQHNVYTPYDTIFNYRNGICRVRVYDAGYNLVDSASFDTPPPFSFHFVPAAPISPSVGVASVSVTGGTPPYTLSWFPYIHPDSIVSSSNPASLYIDPLVPWYYGYNVYGIWIRDAAGCLSGSTLEPGGWGLGVWDTLTKPLSVDFSPGTIEQFSIQPNPVRNSFNAAVNISGTGDAMINVSDITGRVFIEKRVKMQAGTQTVPFNTEQLPTGTYFVRLNNNGTAETRKLIVIK